MPLPPAPTKPADRLTPKAFAASSRSVARPAEKSQNLESVSAIKAPSARPAMEKVVAKETSKRTTAALLDKSVREQAPSAPIAPPVMVQVETRNSTARSRKPVRTGPTKLFVLDTNVLLHDPMSLFRFEEHDIYLPMIVLEELDGHKKGMTEVARNARQTSRTLDALAGTPGADITAGFQLASTGHRDARGKLLFQTQPLNYTLPTSLPQGKADNQILGVVEALRQHYAPREVVLVSKDINMRVKARALGLATDDYQNDKTLEDGDLLYSGATALPSDFWATHGQAVESWQQGQHTFYKVDGPVVPSLLINQFVFFESPGEPSLYARVTEIRGTTAVIKTLRDFNHLKNAVWGVTTRNREQNFAMNLLMDPEVDFVTLTGTARSSPIACLPAASASPAATTSSISCATSWGSNIA